MDINKLRTAIDKADAAYYRPGVAPIMSDEQYDALKRELKKLAPDDERLTRVGVPYSANELRSKVKHGIPMGSLDNIDDFSKWYESRAVGRDKSIMASHKLDGSSVCAVYNSGQLIAVLSRGDGRVGEDITANGVLFKDIPTTIDADGTIYVRGEAILPKSEFRLICEAHAGVPWDEIDKSSISNPRNLGNGIIGRKDGADCDKIVFVAHDISLDCDMDEKFNKLTELGFNVVEHKKCSTQEQVLRFYDDALQARDNLPYEIDGVVVVFNSKNARDIIGGNKLRPRWGGALKFPVKSATTTLEDIIITVGHTGAVIPTAKLKKVRVGGVNVDSALLTNFDEIERLNLHIGDTVEVCLAGDIIPKILRVVESSGGPIIAMPDRCPACGSATEKVGANLYCTSKQCSAVKLAKIKKWIKSVGILGIGDSTLEALVDNGLVNGVADLYRIDWDAAKNIAVGDGGRLGESRANGIKANIDAKRELDLDVFLGALGIDMLGRRRAKMLIDAANGDLDSIDDWLDTGKLNNLNIQGFGDAIRSSIAEGINRTREVIAELLDAGVTIKGQETMDTSGPLEGLTFCFTGTRECINDVERLGGIIKSGVSKSLDYLVQKDPMSSSSKTLKAEKYGVKIISLNALKRVISGELTIQDIS